MLERYTRPEMGKIWSLKNKYAAWLKVEVAATNAWSELGEVPKEDAEKIAKNASFTVERVSELEAITHHDVVAFTRTVSESLGDEKKWVHFGLTSTDVVDTAQGYILKQADEIIRQDLHKLKKTIAQKAKKYKYTVEMGRTHGVQAEPTTFGLKLARWYAEINRDIDRFEHAAKGVESGKISGAVVIHTPSILILDEPTTGLDAGSRKNIWDTILQLQKETKMTVFLTTHYIEEAANSDYVVVMMQK